MKRSPIKRKTALKSKKPLSRTSFSRKLGKKSLEYIEIKKQLDKEFIEMGLINTCELSFKGCIGSILPLTYSHSKKRNKIARDEPKRTEELKEVVRACVSCHDYIEYLPSVDGKTGHERMYEIVTSTINNRKV